MRHPSYVLVERLYDLRRKVILHLSTRGKLETSLGDPACSGVRRAVDAITSLGKERALVQSALSGCSLLGRGAREGGPGGPG